MKRRGGNCEHLVVKTCPLNHDRVTSDTGQQISSAMLIQRIIFPLYWRDPFKRSDSNLYQLLYT